MRNDRANESCNIGSSSMSPIYNKEYYDAREKARSIFSTKKDRSRSPIQNVSTRNNRTLDSFRIARCKNLLTCIAWVKVEIIRVKPIEDIITRICQEICP